MEGEFAALGVPFAERGSRTDEALELFRTVWTEREPAIRTRRHRLGGVIASPMPLQRPRPPIWIGGASEGAYRRVARHGDGWHSTAATPEAFREGADRVRRHWAEARREGEPVLSLRIPFWLDGIHRPGSDMGYLRGRHAIHGTPRQVVDVLRGYAALGVSHVALDVSLTTYPAILETIDVLAREVRPALAA
jgi:alkanesulfonate monooxygenase SsuD/methylene tetrahydromethanopterin reductase-like flavin-dependent oxidoreductase (luciferase family)